ncbi:hypothetical protein NC652_023378 [Populus alba x Populus x berolinensis]|uniref:Uncharacterized protein n=1 Tax=Populus alba x Populus x berolinensis TaxID=444605 RepID=A0AAD6MKZ4_9ROSI|nr:hypothetical protein NC652_023378 [Populus alba x Populus x berolinensis]KAJ6986222.1 hypothetical protein NC653_023960 [Populus alba x Populus x berolinensis]
MALEQTSQLKENQLNFLNLWCLKLIGSGRLRFSIGRLNVPPLLTHSTFLWLTKLSNYFPL